MPTRTKTTTLKFHRSFSLKGVDYILPAGDYRVVNEEELIEGLSFAAYHRVSTVIFVPTERGGAYEMVAVDPLELQAAQDQDAAMQNAHPIDQSTARTDPRSHPR